MVSTVYAIGAGALMLTQHGFVFSAAVHDWLFRGQVLLAFAALGWLAYRCRRRGGRFGLEPAGIAAAALLAGSVLAAVAGAPLDWDARWASPLNGFLCLVSQTAPAGAAGWTLLRELRRLALQSASPAKTVVLSFLGLSLAGAALLMLPVATGGTTSPNISFIDALFTSTSAVCVTGLIVLDTATDFTRAGQWIILGLIQAGGLGIMIAVGVFVFALGGRMGYRGRAVLNDVMQTGDFELMKHLSRSIALTLLGFEAAGFLFLWAGFGTNPLSSEGAWFHALFHSVSAFCNAGFSTFSNSLVDFAEVPLVVWPVMLLIVFGGIGFQVIHEVFVKAISGRRLPRLSLHSRLVLRATMLLLALGFAAVWLGTEWGGTGAWGRFHGSLFQSVTARTAGFNTIPMAAMRDWVLMGVMILMFVGAAPGGTAGGIKVSTAAMLYYATANLMRGRERVEIMRRSIPPDIIQSAFVIGGLSVTYVAFAVMALCWAEPDLPFLHLAFETVSAFGTVGLSLGATPELSGAGKAIIIVTMFIGRIGPLTLFLGLTSRRDDAVYAYPRESVRVG